MNDFLNLDFDLLILIKTVILILLSMLLLLTLIAYKQSKKVMERIIEIGPSTKILKNIGIFLMLLIVSLFLTALVIL